MSSPGFTAKPWRFERMESAAEFAALKGETLADHEGYYRTNSGYWIVTFSDPDGDTGGQICEVTFHGNAKRGQQYNAPDPEGQANARLISAAPELYEALRQCRTELDYCQQQLAAHGQTGHPEDSVSRALKAGSAALEKARGDLS